MGWTEEEDNLLFEGIKKFGRQWSSISKFMGSRQ